MEEVLDLYAEPYDPTRPVVCLDEKSVQLIAETRHPRPVAPGRPARFDYEYQRQGTRNLFVVFQPLAGWRHVQVTEQRTKLDYARYLRDLVDVHFPETKVLRIVQDNLNTHTPAALYAAFEPAEAKRILNRIEWHYTPKHASWLNMVEIELAILANQCLAQRIPDETTLRREVTAWATTRNEQQATVAWRFTTTKARVKLARLYPNIS